MPKPIKLLHITTIPLTQWMFLRGQSAYLKSQGFELYSITSPGELLDKLVERDEVIAIPVPISRQISPLSDLVSLLRLYAAIRRIKPDIVHLSTPKAALLGSIAAWAARVPTRLFFIRGFLTTGATGSMRQLLRFLETLTARLCQHHLCVSPSLLTFARAEGILKPGQGAVAGNGMSNGIDTSRFDPETVSDPPAEIATLRGQPVIGFVGRLVRDKGIEELAAAWAELREAFPRAHLLLVGPWETRDAIDPAIRARLESDPRVHLPGFVANADLPAYYGMMSLFVYPSHREGFPNAPMEAAAMGLPVITTDALGCIDAVEDGVTGKVVPVGDTTALTAAIRAALSDPVKGQAQGRAGREWVERLFRQEVLWEALAQAYRRMVGDLSSSHEISL
jgi:glycosyltransferase involved in cell wall biosynthesis